MAQLKPGFAFSLVCDLGFAVGLLTHDLQRSGQLVWMAEPVFDEEPTLKDVEGIDRWRWPALFPLGAAIRRKIVTPIGVTAVPPELARFPLMRSGNKQAGWRLAKLVDGVMQPAGSATDPSLPIYQIVNDTALKERLVSGWKPEDLW